MARLCLPVIALFVVFIAPLVWSDDTTPIPENKSQLEGWFKANVKPFAERKGTLDPALEEAEARPRIIKVRKDGSGQFKTLTDAVKSIPADNKQRVIIALGPGEYREKVKIERTQPFVTLFGEGNAKPNLTFDGTAANSGGTFYSATLTVESEYFMANNIRFVNSAPMPAVGKEGGQAVAMRIGGDKAAFYGCEFYGFQDTLCDDVGYHFFKDCFIQGTYDFIFGGGTSMYLNTRLNVVGDGLRVITAQAGDVSANTGYAFVHGSITGGKGVFLGRAWKNSPEVLYAYTDMSSVVDPVGWMKNPIAGRENKLVYGEYKCTGAGEVAGRQFAKQLDAKTAAPYLNLGYIHASKWLLPPQSA